MVRSKYQKTHSYQLCRLFLLLFYFLYFVLFIYVLLDLFYHGYFYDYYSLLKLLDLNTRTRIHINYVDY